MTMESNRTHSSTNVVVASSDSHSTPTNPKLPPNRASTNTNTNSSSATTTTQQPQLSFDPMSSSLAKRRYSQRSSSSVSVSSTVSDDYQATGTRAPISFPGDQEGRSGCRNRVRSGSGSSSGSPTAINTTSKSFRVTTTQNQNDGRELQILQIRNSNTNTNTITSATATATATATTIPRGDGTKLFADLPDPNQEKMSPDEFLHKLVFATCGIELEPKKAKSLSGFFAKVTDEQVAAYTMAVVSACRNNDLDALKKLHSEEGQALNCFNRFGESLLTMACRRGFEAIVEFLLHQPDVDVRISDDSGRTILHDACWNPTPQLQICEWIAKRDPALFFIADNRGCTPFQYARSEHWDIWRQFLLDNKECLQALKADDVKSKLWKQKQPQN